MAKLHGLYMVVLITYPNWDDPPWTLAGPAQKVKTIIYIYYRRHEFGSMAICPAEKSKTKHEISNQSNCKKWIETTRGSQWSRHMFLQHQDIMYHLRMIQSKYDICVQ